MKHAADLIRATQSCVYCPTLCLHTCPVSNAERSDAVAPWGKMSMARWLAEGQARLDPENAAILYKCTGCGACQDFCRHHVPVGETLRVAREAAVAEGVSPYGADLYEPPIEPGSGVLPDNVSGYRLYAAGHTERFVAAARQAAARWRSRATLVFAAAEDLRCVRDVYPRFDIEVVATLVLRSEQPPRGRPDLTGPIAYHESCHIARGEGIDSRAIRGHAAALSDDPLIELRWRGAAATCCGAAGAYKETSPEGARLAARRILESAARKGARTLVTGCGACASHFEESRGDLDLDIVALGAE